MGLAASNSALCKRRSRETLAAQSEQSLSVPGTEIFFYIFSFPETTVCCTALLRDAEAKSPSGVAAEPVDSDI